MSKSHRACVVGSGPNGLAAAIVLAQSGFAVEVYEAESTAGGAARTLELTLPGFRHDFGSAVHPLGAGSPFFSSLPLANYGLQWVHSPAPLAHPLDDGTAVVLERGLTDAKNALGGDGAAWVKLVRPFVERWPEFAEDVLRPVSLLPRHLLLMARFGMRALFSAEALARRFQSERTRALFAGLAAHSFLALDEPLSGAFALMMAIPAHAVGWPIARGGSQALVDALVQHLATLGGTVRTSSRVESLGELEGYDLILCDLTPRQLLKIGGMELSAGYRRELERFRYGSGVFKVDYALREPIPWKAAECRRAATLHLGGSFAEIAASEKAARSGQTSERPFVLLNQPSPFDDLRAPAAKHTAWAYCHVPHASQADLLQKIEDQIERFAPGFREVVEARSVFRPSDLEAMDANLVGGDIGGGAMDLRQLLFRPTRRGYATSAKNVYLCSSSTPPGGGVHGMCGYHAARVALARMSQSEIRPKQMGRA
jgi:phytoene dehydrogenase-like protein